MEFAQTINIIAGLILAPLLSGVINRVKALFAGRTGQPLLQPYFDVWKLLRKGAVYSSTTTWVFKAGPVVGLASALAALCLVPAGGAGGFFSFEGDIFLLAGLLALMRFFTVSAALDTGSAFEGMGASREVQFSALAEPALLLGLAAAARKTGSVSLAGILGALPQMNPADAAPVFALISVAVYLVFLCENARIPVDDPNTHLELTMIHEVMVLDHSGPDFAFITYGAALKMWVLGSLLAGLAAPLRTGFLWADVAAAAAVVFGLAAVTGVVESTMARLKMVRVPHLLMGALVLSAVAYMIMLR